MARRGRNLGLPEEPITQIDWAWNSAVDAAVTWDAKNKLKPLSISSVARVTFAERGVVLSGSDSRARKTIISKWGKY
jgi:hypothetical protein